MSEDCLPDTVVSLEYYVNNCALWSYVEYCVYRSRVELHLLDGSGQHYLQSSTGHGVCRSNVR